jgi:hypothetical protein
MLYTILAAIVLYVLYTLSYHLGIAQDIEARIHTHGKCTSIHTLQHGRKHYEVAPMFQGIKEFAVHVDFEADIEMFPPPFNNKKDFHGFVTSSIKGAFAECISDFKIEFINDIEKQELKEDVFLIDIRFPKQTLKEKLYFTSQINRKGYDDDVYKMFTDRHTIPIKNLRHHKGAGYSSARYAIYLEGDRGRYIDWNTFK